MCFFVSSDICLGGSAWVTVGVVVVYEWEPCMHPLATLDTTTTMLTNYHHTIKHFSLHYPHTFSTTVFYIHVHRPRFGINRKLLSIATSVRG